MFRHLCIITSTLLLSLNCAAEPTHSARGTDDNLLSATLSGDDAARMDELHADLYSATAQMAEIMERNLGLPAGELSQSTITVPPQPPVPDGGDDDGSIVWEIVEADAVPSQANGGDDDGSIVWEIVEADAAAGEDGVSLLLRR